MKHSGIFNINEVYQAEVDRLLNSRKRSKVIHRSGNIDASGDELEEPLRALLRRRLPSKYFVGHGHVVDQDLRVSGQLDVIIADNSASPILFEAENGCQYFPWESVYAVGEIKSTYASRKRPVAVFAKTVEHLKRNLKRERTPANYLGNKIFLGKGLSAGDDREIRDPLFTFAVFLDSGDISDGSVAEEYNSISDDYLPVGAFFLDGHMIGKAAVLPYGERFSIGAFEFEPTRVAQRRDIEWIRVSFKHALNRRGHALAILMMALSSHLNSCLLMPPKLSKYLDGFIKQAKFEAGFVSVERIVGLAKKYRNKLPAKLAAELEKIDGFAPKQENCSPSPCGNEQRRRRIL